MCLGSDALTAQLQPARVPDASALLPSAVRWGWQCLHTGLVSGLNEATCVKDQQARPQQVLDKQVMRTTPVRTHLEGESLAPQGAHLFSTERMAVEAFFNL